MLLWLTNTWEAANESYLKEYAIKKDLLGKGVAFKWDGIFHLWIDEKWSSKLCKYGMSNLVKNVVIIYHALVTVIFICV